MTSQRYEVWPVLGFGPLGRDLTISLGAREYEYPLLGGPRTPLPVHQAPSLCMESMSSITSPVTSLPSCAEDSKDLLVCSPLRPCWGQALPRWRNEAPARQWDLSNAEQGLRLQPVLWDCLLAQSSLGPHRRSCPFFFPPAYPLW